MSTTTKQRTTITTPGTLDPRVFVKRNLSDEYLMAVRLGKVKPRNPEVPSFNYSPAEDGAVLLAIHAARHEGDRVVSTDHIDARAAAYLGYREDDFGNIVLSVLKRAEKAGFVKSRKDGRWTITQQSI